MGAAAWLLPWAVAAAAAHGGRGGYQEAEALESAYVATAAYCGSPKFSRGALEAWRCGPACDHVRGMGKVRQVVADGARPDMSGFVGRLRGQCVLALRGTACITDWLEDLRSGWRSNMSRIGIECSFNGSSCSVGSGWLATYIAIRSYVKGNLSAIGCRPGASLAFAGHSLGAAAAQLAMFDLAADGYKVARSYLFGSPRAGDAAWVGAFEARLGAAAADVYRVTLHRDPVPHLPFENLGFAHAGTEVFYDGNVSTGYIDCKGQADPRCASRFHDTVGLIAGCVVKVKQCDHLRYMTARKTILMDGATCANDALGAVQAWV